MPKLAALSTGNTVFSTTLATGFFCVCVCVCALALYKQAYLVSVKAGKQRLSSLAAAMCLPTSASVGSDVKVSNWINEFDLIMIVEHSKTLHIPLPVRWYDTVKKLR